MVYLRVCNRRAHFTASWWFWCCCCCFFCGLFENAHLFPTVLPLSLLICFAFCCVYDNAVYNGLVWFLCERAPFLYLNRLCISSGAYLRFVPFSFGCFFLFDFIFYILLHDCIMKRTRWATAVVQNVRCWVVSFSIAMLKPLENTKSITILCVKLQDITRFFLASTCDIHITSGIRDYFEIVESWFHLVHYSLSKKTNYHHKLVTFNTSNSIWCSIKIFSERFSIFFTFPVIILSLTDTFEHCYLNQVPLKSLEMQQPFAASRTKCIECRRILQVIARVLPPEYCNGKMVQMCRH